MSLEQRQHPLDMRLIRPRNPGPSYVEDDDGVDEQEGTCISCNEDEILWLSDSDEDNNDAVFVEVETYSSYDYGSPEDQEYYYTNSSSKDPPPSGLVRIVKPVPVRLLWRPQDDKEPPPDVECGAEEDEWSVTSSSPTASHSNCSIPRALLFPSPFQALQAARDGLLLALSAAGGRTDGHAFRQCLTTLHEHYQQTGHDVRFSHNHSSSTTTAATSAANVSSEGTWLTLTQPVFRDCLGENDQGDPQYTLGRMSFQMFRPAPLVCSLQGNFNCVQATKQIPDVLQDILAPDDRASFCTYNGLCAFTVEANHTHSSPTTNTIAVDRPCRGILATHGYMCADRHTPNRHTVWITSGTMHANDTTEDTERWKTLFSKYHSSGGGGWFGTGAFGQNSSPDVVVDKDNYTQSYSFRRALGGHGVAYVDTLYLDPSLRIVRGHRGTLFVFSKLTASVQD